MLRAEELVLPAPPEDTPLLPAPLKVGKDPPPVVDTELLNVVTDPLAAGLVAKPAILVAVAVDVLVG